MKHTMSRACFAFASCLIIPAVLPAQGAGMANAQVSRDTTSRNPHAVQPERPTIATHAGTVAPGWVELEEGGEWDKAPDGSRSFFAPTNLKIGLASHAQLNLLFNVIYDRATPGGSITTSDVTIGIKYRVLDGDRILGDFAILPAVTLPTALGRGAGNGTYDFLLLLISSHQLGPVAMDLNAGLTRRSGDGTTAPRTASIWTASFGFPLSGPLGTTIEVFGYPRTTGPAGAEGTAALLIGPTLLVREWLSVDAGIIAPITGPQPHAVYAGFVWNIGCLGPKRMCRP